ncbi:hypothetical protein GO986_08810 [Deinococcus sp. HMF7620]|uniref:Uncharacterized protein n=1 Tax=Deinococcus arboris TaxID=2682977 RepID=A0A7C9M8D8_9DEIO|nr:hypothetical protein [Deinococcus arboris]MVN86863.1 hypothetical protein [Deinococcus arboris]
MRWRELGRFYPHVNPVDYTMGDLVDFGEHVGTRLPTPLQHALAQLRNSSTTFTRARLRVEHEDGQKVAHLSLKVPAQTLDDPERTDEIYEAVEGTSTERLTIRAHLSLQNVPEMHTLPVARAELLEPSDRQDAELAEPEDAWLVLTMGDLFDEHFESTDRLLDAWQVDMGLAQLPRLLLMTVMDHRLKTEYKAIELPEPATLHMANVLAERLRVSRDLKVDVVLAQRVYIPPRWRPSSVYESTREMARRIRKEVKP